MILFDRIQNSIEFIENNLDKDFSLKDVAKASGFSISHLHKIFFAATGFSIRRYIRNRRLSNAAKQLLKTDRKIIDIAVDSGFNSHEVFTRAFTQLYAISPNNYRTNRKELLAFKKFELFGKEIEKKYQNIRKDIKINVMELKSCKITLVGMELRTSVQDAIERKTVPIFWRDRFIPRLGEIKNMKQPYVSVGYEVHSPETDELYHMACVEVMYSAELEGMVCRILPEKNYAVFSTDKALSPVEYSVLIQYIYGEWLPMSGQKTLCDYTIDMNYSNVYYSDEYYTQAQKTASKLKVYIPVK
ncbi:MAG TPA: helix-turn-helix domain-containing protein [Clostridia bacterium]|nr:helix-turn-helix domain-containing protein [Clostridia bacterium]